MSEIFTYGTDRAGWFRKLGFLHFQYKDLTCKLHVHREIEIVIVTEGVLSMKISGQEYAVPAGSAIFVEPYEPHSYDSPQNNKCTLIEFTHNIYQPFYDWVKQYYTKERVAKIPPEYLQALSSALSDAYELCNITIEPIHAQAILAPLCYIFTRNCTWAVNEHKRNDLFLDALDIISNSPIKEISRSFVADKLGVTPETLSRKFKESSNLSFVNYLQHFRISQAIDCLAKGYQIADAAEEAGFGDIRNFNRVFKEIMGCTPTEYLRNSNKID